MRAGSANPHGFNSINPRKHIEHKCRILNINVDVRYRRTYAKHSTDSQTKPARGARMSSERRRATGALGCDHAIYKLAVVCTTGTKLHDVKSLARAPCAPVVAQAYNASTPFVQYTSSVHALKSAQDYL